MIKGYNEFINENFDWHRSKEIHKQFMFYFADRVNKATEHIEGKPITLDLERSFDYDHDDGDDTKGWLYCRLKSERLSCRPDNDPVDDHIEMLMEALTGYKAIESIIDELEEKFKIVIFNQIRNGGTKDTIEILTNIELIYIMNNNELENFLKSQKGIDKFDL